MLVLIQIIAQKNNTFCQIVLKFTKYYVNGDQYPSH